LLSSNLGNNHPPEDEMKALIFALAALCVTFASAPSEAKGCRRKSCDLYVHVSIAEQLMYVYVKGELVVGYQVSTGKDGHETVSWEGHPDSNRIYNRYMSRKYPGIPYIDEAGRDLGNMPYAMFFFEGQAIHGTHQSNWANLGQVASKGCIRMYPELNQTVRQFGADRTWFNIDRRRVGTAEGQRG
jgi:hypothetical protein